MGATPPKTKLERQVLCRDATRASRYLSFLPFGQQSMMAGWAHEAILIYSPLDCLRGEDIYGPTDIFCSLFLARFNNTLQAQLRAASALRGLSVDEDLRTEIVARGGLVPLLRLSSNDDVEIQMEVRLQSDYCNLPFTLCPELREGKCRLQKFDTTTNEVTETDPQHISPRNAITEERS